MAFMVSMSGCFHLFTGVIDFAVIRYVGNALLNTLGSDSSLPKLREI